MLQVPGLALGHLPLCLGFRANLVLPLHLPFPLPLDLPLPLPFDSLLLITIDAAGPCALNHQVGPKPWLSLELCIGEVS